MREREREWMRGRGEWNYALWFQRERENGCVAEGKLPRAAEGERMDAWQCETRSRLRGAMSSVRGFKQSPSN